MTTEISKDLRTREGSPWTGLGAVIAKEMADHLTSARMRILEILILLTAGGTIYGALRNITQTIGQDRFIFLKLFTTGQDPIPAFVGFLGFLVPLIAIAISFDSINGEFNRRTMSRILAQPIFRDALLMGKFLGGLFTLALVLSAIWLLIIGMGFIGLGVPPSGEEIARTILFLVATIFYGGIWLAVSMVFSITFRQPATAALAGISLWLFFTVFWGILANLLAQLFVPIQIGLIDEYVAQAEMGLMLARISPSVLYSEVMVALLQPAVRSLGVVLPTQLEGAVMGAPLPLDQSVVLMWPQLTGMIAITILLFALGYVLFQRQEIRA